MLAIWALAFLVGYLESGVNAGLGCLLIGSLPASLWWSIAMRKWRDWAKRNGADEKRTQVLARRTRLTFPKGSSQEKREMQPGESLRSMGLRFLRFTHPYAVVFLAFALIYGGPITLLILTRREVKSSPGMWLVPTPLPAIAFDQTGGRNFSYFGYEFEVPWTELRLERKLTSAVILNFSNGASVMLFNPAGSANALNLMQQESAKERFDVRKIFGVQATRSNYALLSKTLYSTPRDLSFFSTPRKMAGNSLLLMFKTMDTQTLKGGLYSFQTEWFRGFQEGAPAKDSTIKIRAYDAQNREVSLWIGAQEQADVNRILFSLRPVPRPN